MDDKNVFFKLFQVTFRFFALTAGLLVTLGFFNCIETSYANDVQMPESITLSCTEKTAFFDVRSLDGFAGDYTIESLDPSIVVVSYSVGSEHSGGFEPFKPILEVTATRIRTGSTKIIVTNKKTGAKKECRVECPPPVWSISPTNIHLICGSENTGTVDISGDYGGVKTVHSSNNNIVSASLKKDYMREKPYISLVANNPGKAVITVTDEVNSKKIINVTCEAPAWNLSQTQLTIPYYDSYPPTIYITGDYNYVQSVTSSNPKVIAADFVKGMNSISLEKNGVGEATITVSDKNNQKKTIRVSCLPQPFVLNIKKIIFKDYENDCEEYSVGNYKGYYGDDGNDVYSIYTKIANVISHNTNIATIEKDKYGWYIIPKKVGTTKIEFIDNYGQHKTLKISILKGYFQTVIKGETRITFPSYGERIIKGSTLFGAVVKVKIGKKTYKRKASNFNGHFQIKIPVRRVGTKVTVTIYDGKHKYSIKKKIVKLNNIKIKTSDVYRNTKKMKIKAYKLHKGDIVTVKIGKHVHKKKIKKNKKVYSFKLNINYYKKAGSKVKIQVRNKFRQSLKKKKVKIYYASNVKVGMTKRQCKLVPGWAHPDDIRVYGDTTMWWYDDNGNGLSLDSYLHFYKGRLKSWKIY